MSIILIVDSFFTQFSLYFISKIYIALGILCSIVFVPIIAFFYKFYVLRRKINQIPGPKCDNILFGNLAIITRAVNEKAGVDLYQAFFQAVTGLCNVYEKEKIFRFWLGSEPVVLFYKPETIEAILTSNTIIEKASQYKLLTPWLGFGLLTSGGDKWRTRRKLLTPAFHFRILEDFLPIINEHMNVFIHLLNQRTQLNDGIIDDITTYITRCALDIICETAMGIKMNSQTQSDTNYVLAIHQTGELFLERLLRPWLWNDFVYSKTQSGKLFYKNMNILHSFTDKVIRDRKRDILQMNKNDIIDKNEETGRKRRMAFLDSLIAEHFKNKNFTETDIREEVDTFMFEGHDTTAMAISWTLHLIGLNPEVQDKCHEELDLIFGDEDRDRSINMNDLRDMKYLEAAIKEALRLFPSVPFVGRINGEEISVNGYTIPKGVTCFLFLYQLHRDRNYFAEPELYKPERFLDNSLMTRHPFAFVPFSAGPRNCIGQKFALLEEKAILASVLRHFYITSLDYRDKIRVAPEMVMRPKTPIRIKFCARNRL